MCYTFLFLHLALKFVKKSFLIILTGLLIFAACKKEDSILGLDVQPEDDLLFSSFHDASVAASNTVREDSLLSSLNNLGIYLLGSYNDPVFGRSDAEIFTNFILKDNITNVDAGSKPQMDSVVLSLAYKTDFYGDTLDPLKLNVHLLTNGTSPDSFYFSNQVKPYDPADITESGNGYTFTPRPAQWVRVGNDTVKPQLRIRLNKTWFEENLLALDEQNLVNSATMQQVFKGLYITTTNSTVFSPEGGSILFFQLFDNATRLTFYYHNFTQSGLVLDLTCGAGTGHFNHFAHDYGTAHQKLQSQLSIANDTANGNQNIFLQSMAGLGARVFFPDLTALCDSGPIAVGRAELIFQVDEDPQWQNANYKSPAGLWLRAFKSDGTQEAVVDAGTPWFGGSYDATLKVYKFDIARHINQVCNGKMGNYGFYVYPAESTSKPYRVVLGGGKNSNYPIRLNIAYTKLYKE